MRTVSVPTCTTSLKIWQNDGNFSSHGNVTEFDIFEKYQEKLEEIWKTTIFVIANALFTLKNVAKLVLNICAQARFRSMDLNQCL